MRIVISRNVEITDARIKDLLCCAFEGGSGYWCKIAGYENPESVDVEYKHLELPFVEGAGVLVNSHLDPIETGPVLIDEETIESGLQVMAEKYPHHFDNFMDDNEDAETGDVFLQCCVYGEIVYG